MKLMKLQAPNRRFLAALLASTTPTVSTSWWELGDTRRERFRLWAFSRRLVREGVLRKTDGSRGGRGRRSTWEILDRDFLVALANFNGGNVHGVRSTGTGTPAEVSRQTGPWHVEKGELDTPAGMLAVFQRAVAARLLPATDQAKRRFFAACARARRLARDVVRFVCAFVRKGLWANLCGRDDDAAQALLGGLEPPAPRRLSDLLDRLTGAAAPPQAAPATVQNWYAQERFRSTAGL